MTPCSYPDLVKLNVAVWVAAFMDSGNKITAEEARGFVNFLDGLGDFVKKELGEDYDRART